MSLQVLPDQAKYIFCFTTGRSGTNLLADVLESCECVAAEHEPVPILNGRPMRWLLQNRPGASFFINHKAWCVKRKARERNAKLYADISHVFGKCYSDLLVSLLGPERCIVIRLIRDPVAVVSSYCALNCIPGFNGFGNHWLGDPSWKRVLLRQTPSNVYDAVAWHVFETSVRFERFQMLHKHCHIIPLTFDELVNPSSCLQWLQNIGLTPTSATKAILERVVNHKQQQKLHPIDCESVMCAVDKYRCIADSQIVELKRELSLNTK